MSADAAGRVRIDGAIRAEATLVAISEACPVGVDIECLEPDERSEVLADALTPTERRRLDALSPTRRWPEFIRLWTLKEAGAKALALGMDLDFTAVEGSLDPPALRFMRGVPDDPIDLAVRSVERRGRAYQVSAAALRAGRHATRFCFETRAE